MNESQVYQQLLDEVEKEVYADDQGRIFARSMRAIARLCGCHHSSVQDLLRKLLAGESASEPLKPFIGIDFKVAGSYPDVLIGACIKHFAYYASVTNDTARKFDDIFTGCGVRGYYRDRLGWNKPVVQQPNDEIIQMLVQQNQMLMQQNQQIIKGMEVLANEVRELRQIQESYPGIRQIVHNHHHHYNVKILPGANNAFTIRQFVEKQQGRELTIGECISLGKVVSPVVRILNDKEVIEHNNKKMYFQKDIPLLQTIYEQWLKQR